ncbi:MAG: RNA-directed DNA polymerase [Phycisphaerae bacterium]|nr:RNA-directed DNA polymerase [Phycisphaerae bacterium]
MAETAAAGEFWERLTSWPNLVRAARKARLGKRHQPEVAGFELERERELLRIQDELRSGTYLPGPYRGFWVREPKRRRISAAPYRDRVVHHALINVIGPLFERNFAFDSYANRLGKGTHRAADRYQRFARQYSYVLQCDVVKFFPSVDHKILKGLLRRRIRDARVLWLCDVIIDASNPQEPAETYFPGDDLFTPSERRRGLPIGNLTSQFWANVYLHGLDHFVKRGLGCGGYLRYVDDFVIFGDDKRALWAVRNQVMRYLERLRLRIHAERAQVRPTSRPTRLLGYRCWATHRFLTKENIRRFRRRGRAFQRKYAQGSITWDEIKPRLASWNAHAATANCWSLRWRILGAMKFSRRGPVDMGPCPARRQLEQPTEELPLGESQQEHARQPQQQQRVSCCG